tara:strand:- start:14727 stop:16253 length:1527 start_codon:yes stop_codon:yes gene_type:complete
LSEYTIRSRFAVSFYSNILRGGVTFLVGLLIARSLGPENYGSYAFLMAFFLSIIQILNMGTSNAFYTFLSQRPRGLIFIASYVGWQVAQFIFVLVIIAFILPDGWIANVWLGQSKEWILLAFVATFIHQSAWQTMIHVGEARRMTHRVQYINIVISVFHLLLVAILLNTNNISVGIIFGLVIFEYTIAIIVASRIIPIQKLEGEGFRALEWFNKYREYCIPLAVLAWVSFAFEFYDRWLLQYFSGSKEQAFLSIGIQFSTVCMIATISISRIFWKEIAEAHENNDHERVQYIYRSVSRLLFLFGALLSGFLIPWSDEIVLHLLGAPYFEGSQILAVMLFYSVYQSFGQIMGTMLLATKRTKAQLRLRSIIMAINFPLSYLVLAPHDALIPGWDSGGLGISIKMVGLAILWANLAAWWIAREFNWRFEFLYQIVSLGGALFLGWLSHEAVMGITSLSIFGLIFKGGIAFILYSLMFGVFIWSFPWLTGLNQAEFKSELNRLKEIFVGKI